MEEYRADIREVLDYIQLLAPRLMDDSKADFHLPSGPSREITHRLLRIHWETRQKTGLTDAVWNEKAWKNGRAETIGLSIDGKVIDPEKFRRAYELMKDHLVEVDNEKLARKCKANRQKLAQAQQITQLKAQHRGIRYGPDPVPMSEADFLAAKQRLEGELNRAAMMRRRR